MTKTSMVRPADLSEKRKAQLREEEKAELVAAEKARKRPLSERAADVYTAVNPFATKEAKEAQRKRAAEDTQKREARYQTAKKQSETPFEARKNVLLRNDVPRTLSKKEMDEPLFRRGGVVGSASSRADGVAKRGKTRGRMV